MVTARDAMDDGTPICLSVTIDRRDGSALFDFEGTGARAAEGPLPTGAAACFGSSLRLACVFQRPPRLAVLPVHLHLGVASTWCTPGLRPTLRAPDEMRGA